MSKIQLPIVVTPSRIELGLRCQRRHTLSDILQVASYYSPSLEFGSVIHSGVGAWWLSGDRAQAAGVIIEEWNRRFVMNPRVNQGELSLELALAMINGYADSATLAGPFRGDWQLVSVEDRLEVPLFFDEGKLLDDTGPTATLSFQSDRVVWNKEQQHLVIVDTKTSARMDRRWSRQWETSLQMKLYMAGAKVAYDIENVSVVVEGVLKSVPTVVQYEVCPSWSVGTLSEAVNQAKIVAERDFGLIASSTEGVPRDKDLVIKDALVNTAVNYQECYSYGVECPFRKLCTAEPEERLALLKGEFFEIPEADQGY